MVRNHNPTSPAPTTTTSLYSDPPPSGFVQHRSTN